MALICNYCDFLGSPNSEISEEKFMDHVNIHRMQTGLINGLVCSPILSSMPIKWEYYQIRHDHSYSRPGRVYHAMEQSSLNGIRSIKQEESAPAIEVVVKMEIASNTSCTMDQEYFGMEQGDIEENCGPLEQDPVFVKCQDIFMGHNIHKPVTCRECQRECRLVDHMNGMTRYRSIIRHVLLHLDRPGYHCRYCEKAFNSKWAIAHHIKKDHHLPVKKYHYLDKTNEYGRDIVKLVQWCYGSDPVPAERPTWIKAVTPSVPIAKRCKQKKMIPASPLFYLTKKIMTDNDGKEWFQCRDCTKRIKPFNMHGVKRSVDLVYHIRRHIRVGMFQCGHCDSRFKLKYTIRRHLKTKHGLPPLNNYHDTTNEHYDDVMDVMKWCFGKEEECQVRPAIMEKKITIDPTVNNHSELFKACHDIFANWNGADNISCAKCGRMRRVFALKGSRKMLATAMLIDHARSHMGKVLFTCRHCKSGSRTLNGIRVHLATAHKSSSTADKFKAVNVDPQLINILKECYGPACGQQIKIENENDELTESTSSNHPETVNVNNDDHFTVRKQRVMEILQNWKNMKQRRITCKICQKKLLISKKYKKRSILNWQFILDHVRTHLDRPTYRCRVCRHTTTTYDFMLCHIRKKHRKTCQHRRYEDLADKFHTNIMEMISKCFDE